MAEIHKMIKLRREQLEMSQEDLAKAMGYKSRSSINKIEIGVNDIPQSKIEAFAKALKTTPAYLMGWTEEESPVQSASAEDAAILEAFHKASPEIQEAIRRILKG